MIYTHNAFKNPKHVLRRLGNKVMDASLVTTEYRYLPVSVRFNTKISDVSCLWESLLLSLAQKKQNKSQGLWLVY